MTRLYAALAIAMAAAAPAHADDEGSEQTAVLVGANEDTLGVTISYDNIDGWQMHARPKPGDAVITTTLALPKAHGHYIAYVAPGRGAIALVALSTGAASTAKDTLAWVYTPDGKLLRSWTYGAVLRAAELAPDKTHRSVSHWDWAGDGWQETPAGIVFHVRATNRSVTLAADATTLK